MHFELKPCQEAFPRVCGVEPSDFEGFLTWGLFPPHMWGWTLINSGEITGKDIPFTRGDRLVPLLQGLVYQLVSTFIP